MAKRKTPKDVEALLTPDEVCERLRISRWLLINGRVRAHLHPIEVSSRQFRYRKSDVENYIRSAA